MYYAYFKQDGTLLSVSSKQTEFADDAVVECEVPDHTNGNSIYLDVESLSVQQKQPFNVTTSYNLISGLPAGTRVITTDGEFVVDDGTFETEADVPETITVFLNHPRFYAIHVTIETGPENA